MKSKSVHVQHHIDCGISYLNAGNLNRALDEFNAAIRLDPNNATALFQRALTYDGLGVSSQALPNYVLAISLAPSVPLFCACGACRTWLRDYTGALNDFENALQLSPNDERIMVLRALTYWEMKDVSAALANIENALAINPAYISAYVQRSNWCTQMGDFIEGLQDVETALRLDPGNPNALSCRAEIRRLSNDLVGAVVDCDMCLQGHPSHAMAHEVRAKARADLGNLGGAISDFEKAAKLTRDVTKKRQLYQWADRLACQRERLN